MFIWGLLSVTFDGAEGFMVSKKSMHEGKWWGQVGDGIVSGAGVTQGIGMVKTRGEWWTQVSIVVVSRCGRWLIREVKRKMDSMMGLHY